MTFRMFMDNTGLRISKLGLNVATSTDVRDFLFDSRSSHYLGVYASGTVNMSSFANSSEQITNYVGSTTEAATINYGKTFAAPPLVLVMATNEKFSGACPAFNNADTQLVDNGGFISSQGGSTVLTWKSFVDHLRFELVFLNYTFTVDGPPGIAYLIAEK